MNNDKIDILIPEITGKIVDKFLDILIEYPEFHTNEFDTSPLINFVISVFLGSLIRMLDSIKIQTEGEKKLFDNIELFKIILLQSLRDLPFLEKVEIFS